MRWRQAAGFLGLCLLSASGWLVDAAWPGLLDLAPRRALHSAVLALVFGVVSWKRVGGLRAVPALKLALASVGLLGLPAILIDLTRGTAPPATAAALFTLTAVAIVVLAPYLDAEVSAESSGRLLTPALAGVAGALLLLQFALPTSWKQGIYEALVLLAVVSAAGASLCIYRLLASFTLLQAALVCCVGNAVFFWAVATMETFASGGTLSSILVASGARQVAIELATAMLFDLPQLLLLLWLLRVVEPTRLAARYFAIPLFSVLEGYAVLHAGITWQPALGALLLAAGAFRLLTIGDSTPDSTLSLR